VVHTDVILDTRAQKMVSHTAAHYRIGLAHDQHGEEQNTSTAFLTLTHLTEFCNSESDPDWTGFRK